jgi:5-methylcytosine-specific restriction endonuclease McrA
MPKKLEIMKDFRAKPVARSRDNDIASQIRRTSRWNRYRQWFRANYPLCCDPLGKHGDVSVPMIDTHHIDSIRDAPEKAFDPTNCAPLCRSCHAEIEQMERAGKITKRLFDGHVQAVYARERASVNWKG